MPMVVQLARGRAGGFDARSARAGLAPDEETSREACETRPWARLFVAGK